MGIPADKLSVVFESFRQLDSGLAREHDGLGLGLSLVERLTALLQGEVTVHSVPGVGSTFTLSIPLSAPTEPAPSEVAVPGLKRRGSAPILLVEDNDVATQVVTHILRRGHYSADRASSGPQALELAARHHYDLILMDLRIGRHGRFRDQYSCPRPPRLCQRSHHRRNSECHRRLPAAVPPGRHARLRLETRAVRRPSRRCRRIPPRRTGGIACPANHSTYLFAMKYRHYQKKNFTSSSTGSPSRRSRTASSTRSGYAATSGACIGRSSRPVPSPARASEFRRCARC